MRRFTASIGAIVVLVLLSSVILPGVALGQVGGGTANDDGNTTSANESETSDRLETAVNSGNANSNESGNSTAGNESGETDMPSIGTNNGAGGTIGNSDGGDGGIFNVEERVKSLIDALVADGIAGLQKIIDTLVEELNYLLFSLPAPGEPSDPMSWYLPDNGWWPDIMRFYGIMASAAFAIFVPSLMLAMIKNDSRETRNRARFVLKAMGMVLAGPLLIGAFLHTFNGVNVALAPSGTEFLSTPQDAAQLSVGATLFLILLKFHAVIILLGLVLQLAQFVLVHVAVGMWPASWGFRALPSPTFEALGEFGVNTIPLLVLLNFGQVAILRLLFEINWGAYGWGAVIAGLLGTAVVLLLTLVGAPYMLFKQQWQAVGVSIGTKQAKQAGSDAADFASAKFENVRARFDDSARGSGSSDSSSSQPSATSHRLSGTPSSGPRASTDAGRNSSQDIDRRRRDL
ncbi:hypothetical protein HAPAU_42050 [Halalkalicoccus paucihalophilus]|uniref:Uncharacterized protein n=1 Tax=Halalkalicoccus paucihalophilus TaxID=1008153 RepID=A0A151A7W2_9EURY|nr:hypothetical protein [Halalkalicoccus paucihalophilus]KYH23725.1 hypothetical protein HAPAU_42050 [Halalkalicoccus paucihalophilus]